MAALVSATSLSAESMNMGDQIGSIAPGMQADIVAFDGHTLVFCEVKTRRREGGPWESLHASKREQVRRMGAAFLADVSSRPRARDLRFDAVGVVIDAHGRLVALDHLEGAF